MESTTIFDLQTPSGAHLEVHRYRFGEPQDNTLRIAFVAGIRGDAPEGMRIAYRLMESLKSVEHELQGVVDIYPCVNPLAAEQGMRLWPSFGIDQNRQFPGNAQGHPPARLAHRLIQDLEGVDLVIELRGGRPGFAEVPQAMIRAVNADNLLTEGVTVLDVARQCNTSIVWKRSADSKAKKTFGNQFSNVIVLEGGQGNRLTDEVGEAFADGCLYLLTRTTVLPEALLPFPWMAMEDPVIVNEEGVCRARVSTAGLFFPSVKLGDKVTADVPVGVVMHPRGSSVVETVYAPVSGRVLALRNQPVVSSGELVMRIQQEQV